MRMLFQHLVLRGSKYYYRRRVPTDLRQFYSGADIVQALRTSDQKLAIGMAEALDKTVLCQWDELRDPEKTIAAQGRLLGPKRKVLDDAALRAAGREAGELWSLFRFAERLRCPCHRCTLRASG